MGLEILENHSLFCSSFFCIPIWDVFIGSERERERERADGWLKFQGGICIHFLVNWDHGKTFIHIAITLYLNQNTIRLSCFYKYLISYFHLISNP